MRLYYHKTDGGAEYLMDTFMEWEHDGKSGREGVFQGAKYIVRIDGDITKDAELIIKEEAFPCVRVARDDLVWGGVCTQEQADSLTNQEMQTIAEGIGVAMMENFFDSLDYAYNLLVTDRARLAVKQGEAQND